MIMCWFTLHIPMIPKGGKSVILPYQIHPTIRIGWKNHRSSGYRTLSKKHREVDCCQGKVRKSPNPKFDALTVKHKNGYILVTFYIISK